MIGRKPDNEEIRSICECARRKGKPVREREYEVFASAHGEKEKSCERGNTKYLRVRTAKRKTRAREEYEVFASAHG